MFFYYSYYATDEIIDEMIVNSQYPFCDLSMLGFIYLYVLLTVREGGRERQACEGMTVYIYLIAGYSLLNKIKKFTSRLDVTEKQSILCWLKINLLSFVLR